MLKSVTYVIKENLTNLYRIFSIAKYELLADIRDSKFGLFWNFASPTIQVLTYWLVFGVGFGKKPVDGIAYLPWVVVGFAAWWFISPCITQGCKAIFSKINVITKMKFPISVLPATVCLREFFNHLCMLVIMFITLLCCGYFPDFYWLGLLYYAACAFLLVESLAMITSVLTMIWRDVHKLVTSIMRMIMYFSPVIWEATFKSTVPFHNILNIIIKLNPVYYVVQGYRDVIFYDKTIFAHPVMSLYFWLVIIFMFTLGSCLMYHFKRKMIDMI